MNMTSQYYPLNSDNINQYPYVDKVSYKVGEEDEIDFIYQYVKISYVFYSQPNECFNDVDTNIYDKCYNYNDKCYNNKYICGKPTKFPNYGKFPEIFTMITYGPQVSISPWQDEFNNFTPQDYIENTDNYVYIEFEKAVYPIRVSIYEVYNPGYIIEILAQKVNCNWFLLWNESQSQIVPQTSRLFSPPLQTCDFKTKRLKLKFKHNLCNNYTMIDAVMLIGSSKMILPKNGYSSGYSLTALLKTINYTCFHYENNLTSDYENAHLDIDHLQKNFTEYCTIYKRDIKKTDYQMHKNISPKVIVDHELQRCLKCLVTSVNKSQNLSCYNLSTLPDEVILKILRNLNLLTLCRISQVNKRFNDLTRDPSLYKCLNVRYINRRTFSRISDIFDYFIPRCQYLQQLNLILGDVDITDFARFLKHCGRHLTHLRLGLRYRKDLVSPNSTLYENLEVLDLTSYHLIPLFANLQNLQYLNFSNMIVMNSEYLCKILQENQCMRELNLNCTLVENINIVLVELKNSCRNLEIIYLDDTCDITSEDVEVLSDCKSLRKIKLPIDDTITNESLCKLFSSCQHLEEVHFRSTILYDYDFEFLTGNKNLIKLCLHKKHDRHMYRITDVRNYFSYDYSIIFKQCPKLQKFYVAHDISDSLINQWKLTYPNVTVSTCFNCSLKSIK